MNHEHDQPHIYGSCCCACREGSGAVVFKSGNISGFVLFPPHPAGAPLTFAFAPSGPWKRQSNDSNCNVSAEGCAGMDPQPYDPDLKRPLGHLIVPAQVSATVQIEQPELPADLFQHVPEHYSREQESVFCPPTQLMQVAHSYTSTNAINLSSNPPSSVLEVRLEMAVSSVTPLPPPSPHPLPLYAECAPSERARDSRMIRECSTPVVGLYLTIIRHNPAACNTLCSPDEGCPASLPYSSRFVIANTMKFLNMSCRCVSAGCAVQQRWGTLARKYDAL